MNLKNTVSERDYEDLIGKWVWTQEQGGITDSGELYIYKDRSYSYKIVRINHTETLTDIFIKSPFRWSLDKNNIFCLDKGADVPPDCESFSVDVDEGKANIVFNSLLLPNLSIEAVKVSSQP